jgi:hypothetical protein
MRSRVLSCTGGADDGGADSPNGANATKTMTAALIIRAAQRAALALAGLSALLMPLLLLP